MTEDSYRVYKMPFPGDIKAAVRVDPEGYASIYINDALAPQAAKKAFLHELRHIQRDDLYNGKPIDEIETEE